MLAAESDISLGSVLAITVVEVIVSTVVVGLVVIFFVVVVTRAEQNKVNCS